MKRKLLMDTTNAILLYGCEVWEPYLKANCRVDIYKAVERTSALRVTSSYRTVSYDAVFIIRSTIPIDLLVKEQWQDWQARNSTTTFNFKVERHTLQISNNDGFHPLRVDGPQD